MTAMKSTGDAIHYRPGAPTDAPAIARLNVATWRTCFKGIAPQAHLDGLSLEKRTESFRGRHNKSGYVVFVAERAPGMLLGYCDAGEPRESRWPYAAELFSIYIDATQQRRGIGRELFRRTARTLIESGRPTLFLRTLEISPFRIFYERLGGRLIDREEHTLANVRCDHAVYAWDEAALALRAGI